MRYIGKALEDQCGMEIFVKLWTTATTATVITKAAYWGGVPQPKKHNLLILLMGRHLALNTYFQTNLNASYPNP